MRIAGITIPDKKRLEFSLTVLYGIGRSRAQSILKEAKVDPALSADKINADQEGRIRAVVEKLKLEGDLKRLVSGNIKRLKDIKAYRGSRHAKHMPARGQRTKTNSRTVRGNVRRTMGSGRRKLEKT